MVSRSRVAAIGKGITIPDALRLAAKYHGNALWVSLSMPMDYVDPLDKGAAIVGEARLAMNIDKLTEPAISSGRITRLDGERFATAEDL